MNKSQLKSRLKPIIKECIQEILFEQGLLSNIISEVVGGLQGYQQPVKLFNEQKTLDLQKQQLEEEQHQQLKEQKRKLLNAAGFQTNVFEGVDPISQGGTPSESPSQQGPLSNVDPNDAGVDLTGIMAVAGRDWSKMI